MRSCHTKQPASHGHLRRAGERAAHQSMRHQAPLAPDSATWQRHVIDEQAERAVMHPQHHDIEWTYFCGSAWMNQR
jgi:hypothetical protein